MAPCGIFSITDFAAQLARLIFSSFFFFAFFETFPSLIEPLHLHAVSGYYAYKVSYIPDPVLSFRERPFNRSITQGYKGSHYSRRYGIEVTPWTIDWTMDQEGFRNGRTTDSSDLVVLGDSYLEYGDTEADIFPARLEQNLPGMTVRNLGKSGYAPFQYVEVLKRFGLKYKPRYALMAFYEGNDIQEMRDYLLWKRGKTSADRGHLYSFANESLLRRYWAAVTVTRGDIRKNIRAFNDLIVDKISRVRGYGHAVHQDIAILNLGGRSFPKLFIDKFVKTTTEEMLRTEEFYALAEIFADFRNVCEDNGIQPIIIYIPAAVHIYAQYSSETSGLNWLKERDVQIAASEETENAVTYLARASNVDLISLSPSFNLAAKEGKLVYYPLDAHWNAAGTEIAASFVADTLKSRYLTVPLRRQAN